MITSSVNRVIYKGNGVATEFAYPFKIFDRTDIKVLLVDKDGNRSILTSDYYVDMEAMKVYYPGYAPGAEEPEADRPDVLQEDETLVLYREVPITQMDRLPEQHPFNVIEKMDDKSCVIDQQLADKLTRAIVMGEETALTFDGKMPPIQPGKTLRVKEDGSGWDFTEDPGLVYEKTVLEKEQAAAQARAAALSADSANRAAQKAYDDGKALIEKDVTDAQNAASEAEVTLEQTKVAVNGVVEKLDELKNDGIFEYDANIDLQPVETPIRNQYYEVDEEGNLKPIDMSTIIGNLIYEVNNKQSKLIAGNNISIEGNVISATSDIEVDLSNYYTKAEIDNKNYLTQHQDISGKADKSTTYTKTDVDNKLKIPITVNSLADLGISGTCTFNELCVAIKGKGGTWQGSIQQGALTSGVTDLPRGYGMLHITALANSRYYVQYVTNVGKEVYQLVAGATDILTKTVDDLKASQLVTSDGVAALTKSVSYNTWKPQLMTYNTDTNLEISSAYYYRMGAIVICSARVNFKTTHDNSALLYINKDSLPITPANNLGTSIMGAYRISTTNENGVLMPQVGINNNLFFNKDTSPFSVSTNEISITFAYLATA